MKRGQRNRPWTSWAGVSNAIAVRETLAVSFTPTRRRRHWPESREKSRRSAGRTRTWNWLPCCTSSTGCYTAGPPTSGPVCRSRRLLTYALLLGGRLWHGYAANTAVSPGKNSAAATAMADGGPNRARSYYSTPLMRARPGIGIGEHVFPPPGRSQHQHNQPRPPDSWRAGCGESRTSGSGGGPQKRASHKTGTALRSDLTM